MRFFCLMCFLLFFFLGCSLQNQVQKKIDRLDREAKILVNFLKNFEDQQLLKEKQETIRYQFKNFTLSLIEVDRSLRQKGNFSYAIDELNSIQELNSILARIKMDSRLLDFLEFCQRDALHELDRYDRLIYKEDPFFYFRKGGSKVLR